MPVTINKIEFQRRIHVTGDPATYTDVPCPVQVGDMVYREDGDLSYVMTLAGLVLGTSLDESPIFTSATVTTKFTSTTALATPSALAATNGQLFASTVSGATLMGFGTTGDATIKNRAGTDVIVVTANTTGVTMAGALAMTGALSGVTTLAGSGAVSGFTSAAFSAAISSSSPSGGIGYATGAGGAQTQATSKATTVVSNTITTAITMDAASLAAATVVAFTFTNSAIAATDTVVCTHQSAGTSGAYTVNAFPGAGSAVISVRNNTAGALAEAIVLRVTVIKSVSA